MKTQNINKKKKKNQKKKRKVLRKCDLNMPWPLNKVVMAMAVLLSSAAVVKK